MPMRIFRFTAAIVAASIVAAFSANRAACAPSPTPSPTPLPSPVASPGAVPVPAMPMPIPPGMGAIPGGETEGQQPYDRFTDGAKSQSGLFTVWRKQGQVFLELTPQQLDHPYLLVPILASGIGEGLFSGIDFDTILLQFHRNGPMILTTEQNPHAKANPGTPVAEAVALSYPQSIISSDPIVAVDHASGDVVIPASVFLTDILDLTDIINGPATISFGPIARYHFDPRLSYFGPTKSFPKNVDLEADITMSSSSPGPTDTVPDSRSLFLRVHYSIVELPNDGYRPRYADDRVGFFITARRQYDDEETQTSFVRYIDRWNIEKTDPRARISPAKNPIVYYLSNDIPVRYRKPITQALLTWNDAFERIGITHAVVVRQQPSDPSWDPDDVRYSVVRWVVSPDSAFAYGPSLTDPLTGEIFRADVVIDGNLVRFGRDQETDLVDPTTGMTAAQHALCSLEDCDYGYGAHEQVEWASLALSMDGALGTNGMPPPGFVDTFLRSIVLHESGHDLGLRHNFAASTVYTPAELKDKGFTDAHGLSASVMGYLPVNLSPHGQPQGDYFQTMLGPWDYFNIKYGYGQLSAASPDAEVPALQALAAQTSQPQLVYGTDEDDEWFDGFASDPRVETFALSSDPLSFAQDQLTIDHRLFALMPERLPLRGHSYYDVRRGFIITLANVFGAANLATHFIGGEYFSRAHRGDPGAPVPFRPLARATEQRAFALLNETVFEDGAMQFSPALLNRLGDSRYNHWESDPNAGLRLDFPVEEFVEVNQQFLLGQIWQPTVMERLDAMDARESAPGQSMDLADLFDWTDDGVWDDLSQSGVSTVPEVHRALQERYAEVLEHVMLHPDPGTPPDASALARHHLAALRDRLDAAIARGGYDEATQANFEQIRSSVNGALTATTVVGAP
jgi:hypothetical protein